MRIPLWTRRALSCITSSVSLPVVVYILVVVLLSFSFAFFRRFHLIGLFVTSRFVGNALLRGINTKYSVSTVVGQKVLRLASLCSPNVPIRTISY